MSNFNLSISTIIRQEGGYVDDPRDPGGATNYGVSLRFLKSIGEIDGDIDLDGDIDIDDIKSMTKDHAIDIYKKHWWDKYGYQRISNQEIATKIFSLSVNMGHIQAHKCLQRAVRASSGELLKEDGLLGKMSMLSVNYSNPISLLSATKSEAAGFYRSLNKPHYINGWLNRAYE